MMSLFLGDFHYLFGKIMSSFLADFYYSFGIFAVVVSCCGCGDGVARVGSAQWTGGPLYTEKLTIYRNTTSTTIIHLDCICTFF